jgi:hypothetical protein
MAAALQHHVGAGRLTLDEFSTRADAAYPADALQDLDALLDDLPGPVVGRYADSHRALVVVVAVLFGRGPCVPGRRPGAGGHGGPPDEPDDGRDGDARPTRGPHSWSG